MSANGVNTRSVTPAPSAQAAHSVITSSTHTKTIRFRIQILLRPSGAIPQSIVQRHRPRLMAFSSVFLASGAATPPPEPPFSTSTQMA